MKEKIDSAIKHLAEKIVDKDSISAGDVMHLSQAILNLSNAKGRLKDTEKQS